MLDNEKVIINESEKVELNFNRSQVLNALGYITDITLPPTEIIIRRGKEYVILPESFRYAVGMICEIASKVLGITSKEICDLIDKNNEKAHKLQEQFKANNNPKNPH